MNQNNVVTEVAKTVVTQDLNNIPNGYLVELFKGEDGLSTEVVLTVAYPGATKGYHAYRNRTMRFVCVYGEVSVNTINLFTGETVKIYLSSRQNEQRMIIPPNHAILLDNPFNDSAYIISYPDPPYIPGTDEQFKLTYKQVMQIVKDKSWDEQKV